MARAIAPTFPGLVGRFAARFGRAHTTGCRRGRPASETHWHCQPASDKADCSVIGTPPDFRELTASLSIHPAAEAMAQAVRQLALRAASDKDSRFPASIDIDLLDSPPPEGEWVTDLGDTSKILARGAASTEELALLETLLALGLRQDYPSSPEQELETAGAVVWLTAHTSLQPIRALEAALGDRSSSFWQATARIVEDPSQQGCGRTEALVAAAALRASEASDARQAISDLSQRLSDPLLRSMLLTDLEDEGISSTRPSELAGELSPAPKGPVLTAVLAFTLVLALSHLVRLVGRYAFAFKRPAKLRLSERGLEISYHTELLGKTLRERATLVPLSNLARVTREVRFARAGMYAGLVALVLGSYFGMGLFMDGVRVPGGSATLLGLAVLFILLGLAADFGLSSLSDSVRGKCRLLVVPRKGPAVCIGALSTKDADAILNRIAERGRA